MRLDIVLMLMAVVRSVVLSAALGGLSKSSPAELL